MKHLLVLMVALLSVAVSGAYAGEARLGLEGGAAWQSRNEYAVPGDTGTRVNLADADSGPARALRATLTWDYSEHASLRLLAAPLRLTTVFIPGTAVAFQGSIFAAGVPVETRYRFDSYRATWFHRFTPGARWSWRLGATAKIRAAAIRMTGGGRHAEKSNVGPVPLLYAGARYRLSDKIALDLEADALAAPQGRAEDIALKAVWQLSPGLSFELGYRLLEGGADNQEVFTFSTFHYVVAGVSIRL